MLANARFIVVAVALLALSPYLAVAASGPPAGYSSTEIHLKFKPGTRLQSPELLLPTDLRNSVAEITRLFAKITPQQLDRIKTLGENRSRKKLPDLNLWYGIKLKPGTDPIDVIDRIRGLSEIEKTEFAPLPPPPPAITPDFSGNQGYLGIAPAGIDAVFSWSIPGGNGNGIKIYDLEYSWNQNHEDLTKATGIPLLLDPGDSAVDPFSDNNHGTGVLGELIADNDNKGVTGISWGADIGLAPAATAALGYSPANAILRAVADGAAGDVILIEQQASVCGLAAFGPSEAISSVFDAIQTAVANGFVVVEAAGNGAVELDQAACGTAFNRTVRDSGAIIVGAGQPPGSGADRERESFSTYGSRVDLQGWGSSVTTTGVGTSYVDPDDPGNRNRWYTNSFGGTSSASPIVAGAAANLQGIALAHFGVPLSPSEIRALLVETGSVQQGDTSRNIGPRPDLFRAVSELIGIVATTVFVDVKPENFPNSINPKNKGVIPVAILTTNTFDATTVDTATVRFGRNGVEARVVQFSLRDVDGDGDRDLILHFNTQATGLQCGDTSATLRGRTFDGGVIEGADSIRTVGCDVN